MNDRDDTSDFWRMLAALLSKSRWYLVAGFATGVLLAALYAYTRVPLYESQALLAIPREDSNRGSIAALVGQAAELGALLGLPDVGGTDANETVAVMKSTAFTMRFIDKHDVLSALYPDEWDAHEKRWRKRGWLGFGAAAADRKSDGPATEQILNRFDDWRTVVIDRRTGMIKCTMRAPTPQLAHDWLAATVDEVNAELRKRIIETSSRAIELIRARMADESIEEVRKSLAALLESELKKNIVAETRPDFALRMIDPATFPERIVWPRRVRIALAGGVLGLLAGLLFGIYVSARRARPVTG